MSRTTTKTAIAAGEGHHVRHGDSPEAIRDGFANHLKYDLAEDRYTATPHDRFLALGWAVRDRLVKGWIRTQQAHHYRKVKRVYYLSLEFLMGRAMANNVINLGIENQVGEALASLGIDWRKLCELEEDAGLGNGGLGRLAACFLDSLATLDIPAYGYGIRYDYGIFRQKIENGRQVEEPDDWLRYGSPWEIARPDYRIPVHFGGRVVSEHVNGKLQHRWVDTQPIFGIPYDRPVVGYGAATVNTLRLWSARGTEEFDFADFNAGDYIGAVEHKVTAETLTKVLYPNDQLYVGKELRLRQQYFFVACSLVDILRRFKKDSETWDELPEKVAIQLNDTHPALAIPEMMRLLMDDHGLEWNHAWDLTVRTFSYTNHTLLPEALETWPVSMLERLLPRHLAICYEINYRFLEEVKHRYPGRADLVAAMSLFHEQGEKRLRMAYLSIIGSHSTNGVARLHTELLRARVVPEFADMFPERFNSKTNGVTPRRWLLKCNPSLASLITEAIGEGWVTDLDRLRGLEKFKTDASFIERYRIIKDANKASLANLMNNKWGFLADPKSLFDVQIKRIHEYKRQLLNALHIIVLYRRLLDNPGLDMVPRTFIFSGKAAPGYFMAKLIIKLINNLAQIINRDPLVKGRIKVFFLPNYGVSLAERIIPAADLSEQISTAGKEASGTGNMKLMMNGALTMGTLDGANVEILEEVGDDNIFIFGLTADEVEAQLPTYNPWDVYHQNEEVKGALDMLAGGWFDYHEPGIFAPLRHALLDGGDYYMHLADLPQYATAQSQASDLFRKPADWARKALLNTAAAGKFSSDRTILEYASEIWNAPRVSAKVETDSTSTLMISRDALDALDAKAADSLDQ